jgi:quinohemoprotein ethanol dehydrogenase
VYLPIHGTPFIYGKPDSFQPARWPRTSARISPANAGWTRKWANDNTYGRLIAWDPVAQKEVWRVERAGPANGGALATAGGLVFQGTGSGQFTALDAATAAELWSAPTQTGVIAAPISYEHR